MTHFEKKYVEIIKNGRVGVIATDTLYGIVGLATSREAVERIYTIKKRNPTKPLIILIASYEDLKTFGVDLSEEQKKALEKFWPGPVSIVLPWKGNEFEYLDRGTGTLAFRFPKKENLLTFLIQTGPLVAPSANPEGLLPATTIPEAKEYFGDTVDFYLDEGTLNGSPSTLILLDNEGKIVVIREGKSS